MTLAKSISPFSFVDPLEGDTPVGTPLNSPPPTRPGSPFPDQRARPATPTPSEKTLALDVQPDALEKGKVDEPVEPESEFHRKSILTVCGTTLLMLVMFGFSNSAGVFQAYYASNKLEHLKPGTISWIGSTHLMICFSLGLVSGSLFDRGWSVFFFRSESNRS